jgi:hypothetical protein
MDALRPYPDQLDTPHRTGLGIIHLGIGGRYGRTPGG